MFRLTIRPKCLYLAPLYVMMLAVVGCRPAASRDDLKPSEGPAASQDHAPASDSHVQDVKLDVLNYDEIQQRIAEQRGKVVVMDAWSTSCPPCMKDFHNLVELHKQYGPAELACISLSFDYEGLGKPEDVSEGVLTFLRSQGATFDNLMSNEESDVLYRKFDLNAVPAVFVYDRSGKLRQRFESEGAYEQVRALVADLVKEMPAGAAATDAGRSSEDDAAGL